MKIPFANVCPISFFLSFVQIDIKIDDELLKECLSNETCLEFRAFPASLELEILFFLNISSDGS
jgi:hypothetical protein